jgi:hypothetical protein
MTKSITMGSRVVGPRGRMAGGWRLAVIGTALLIAMSMPATSAQAANLTITPGSFATTLSTNQAGAHPDLTTTFALDTDAEAVPLGGQTRDLKVELPKGLVGAANATPTCPMNTVAQDPSSPQCPLDTAVGEVLALVTITGQTTPITWHTLLFNVTPNPGEPAAFGFNALYPVRLDANVRSDSDYGITASSSQLTEAGTVVGATVTLWGVPADHNGPGSTVALPGQGLVYGGRSNSPRVPFLTNPTECSGSSLFSSLSLDSWLARGVFATASYDLGTITGCDRLAFAPAIDLRPDSRTAGAPAGLAVNLSVPQNPDPDGLATAHVKDVSVKLPAGMALSAAAVDGLGACSDEQIAVHSLDPASCPDASKIGTVEVTTPLLDDALGGEVYLGTQKSQDPQSGDMFRIFVQAAGSGVRVKLPGAVRLDPASGQLSATFASNPQLPFDSFKLRFKGGSRAPLANPEACGTKTTDATISSWAGASVRSPSSFVIDQSCDQASKFEPTLNAGLTSPRAGGSSPFTTTVSRPSGQQDINGLNMTLPPGLLANIGSVTQCAEADANAGSCPAASQIGRTIVASGNGSTPVYIPQPGKAPTAVYLAGPYKGAPYSLSIVVPAQAGPYDLGTVVVRAALRVDPLDGHVTAESDPIPTMLLGVPLDVQKINVVIDRPALMVAPTNCDPMQISGTVGSAQGASATVANGFQVTDCATLNVKPKLALSLSGKGQTTDGKHPAITASLTQAPGQANLKKVRVALPLSLALDPDNANGLCEFVDGSKVEPTCPKASIVGQATARTPILNEPLTGPVYFVKNIRKDPKSGREIRTLPKLVIPLVGPNGLRLTLTGTSAVENDQLVTTFDNIPDAPVSSFQLDITGGKGGILTVSGTDICKATQVADQQINGQNGKVANADITIQTPACATKIISKKVGKTSVVVKVGGLGAGKVTISGKGIKKTSKTITNTTVATISARRTKGKPGKVTVSFDPTGPAKARKTSK